MRRRLASRRWLLLGGVLTLWACGSDRAKEAAGTPVTAERVAAHKIVEQIQATGELLAVEEASVAAEVSGRITALRVSEGAPVHKGDVVLEIDRERRELELANEKAMVAGAHSEIDQVRRERDRVHTLFKSGAASQAQRDAASAKLSGAEASLAAAEAQLGLAKLALRNASVAAPFDGLVARRFVSTGDHVSEGGKLFDLVALDPIEVEFHLAERDSGRVAVGRPVEVRVTPYPEEVFHATVSVVSPRIDPDTRTLRVKALVDNPERKLRPGLFARADLGVAEREHVPMVPEQALLQRSDGTVVFVVRDGNRAERRQVRLGLIRGGLAEVVDGVAVGDQVIVRGSSRLVDGSVIDLRRADGGAVDVLGADRSEPAVAGDPAPARSLP
jgi:membrane fusion protein (multidrug efflux system)